MPTTQDKEFSGNAVRTTITNTINAVDTAVSIAAATGWPTGAQPFTAVINRGESNEEKVLCSSRSGLGLTIVGRGFDNTSPTSHGAGAPIEHCIAGADFDALFRHATDVNIDDHTQYMHISTARTVTAVNTFNNVQRFNMKDGATSAIELRAAGSAIVGVLRQFAVDNSTVFEITDIGYVKGSNDAAFGTGANGANGTFLVTGSLADSAGAWVDARGSGPNVNLNLRAKGTGSIKATSTNAAGTGNPTLQVTTGDVSLDSGVLRFAAGPATTATATAGGGVAAPATVGGFIKVQVDGVVKKIPYYSN